MTCYVDTSALYALLDADDRWHMDAREVWRGLLEGREPRNGSPGTTTKPVLQPYSPRAAAS